MQESLFNATEQKNLDLKNSGNNLYTVTVVDWILTAAMPRKICSVSVGL